MRLIIQLFLICFAINANAQTTYRDELKARLETEKNEKSYLYKLVRTEKKKSKRAVVYNHLGLIYQRESNLDSAEYCHRKALQNALAVGSKNQEIGVSYNKVGIVFYYRGELDSAVTYFDKSISYFSDEKLKANSLNNLALMNKYNSNPDLAIKNYLKASSIFKELGDTLNESLVYNNIGALYKQLEDLESAKRYLNRGLHLVASNAGFIEAKYDCRANLADVYLAEKKYEKAMKIFHENIAYYKETKNYSRVIVNQNNLAGCYSDMGNESEALMLYLKVLSLMEDTGLETHKGSVLNNIGSCFEYLDQYDDALKHYSLAKEFAISNEETVNLETIYKGLASVHLKLNNADSSIFYKDLQIALRDSLDKVEKEKKMMELEAKHRNKELDSELLNAHKELDNVEGERSLFATGFAYAILIILVTVFIVIALFIRYKRKKQLAQELNERNAKNRDEISSLTDSLDSKEEEIERLSVQSGAQKVPYPLELAPLTDREKEVLVEVKEGLKDQEIADKLFISIATVRTHLRKAYVKIDARNRAEAIQFISKYQI
ncbi:MAG: tetratricopeptide repeat protein [Crocinitomicaceae bacterium]